jgi:hypothetical protein
MILSRYLTFKDKFTSVSANTALVNALLLIRAQASYPFVHREGKYPSVNQFLLLVEGIPIHLTGGRPPFMRGIYFAYRNMMQVQQMEVPMNKTILFSLLIVMLLLASCATAEADIPQTVAATAVDTSTPEVLYPLDPSPTPVNSDLPKSCQVTDLKVYTDKALGYCFAYPAKFTLGEATKQRMSVVGPSLDQSAESLSASLEVEVQPVTQNSNLARLVDGYLSQTGFQNLPWTIERSTLTVAGEPAERLELVPGLGSARLVMVLHNNQLFTLRFHPLNQELAKPDLEALYQTVTGSFAFFDATGGSRLPEGAQTANWNEFGATISLSYNPELAPWVETLTVPAIPANSGEPYFAVHPAYTAFRFLGFQGGRVYDLPFVTVENRVAQVLIFQTTDFPGYMDDSPFGFSGQLQALSDLLQNGVDPARCAEPMYAYEESLPFLPWLNSKQTFCAQPQILNFESGKGLRYLTFYSQGVDPALDSWIFYTFQGLSDDGKFYISASFPVATGIFPNEPPKDQIFPDQAFIDTMKEQVVQLNAQAPDRFEPSLSMLDALVGSIRIETR